MPDDFESFLLSQKSAAPAQSSDTENPVSAPAPVASPSPSSAPAPVQPADSFEGFLQNQKTQSDAATTQQAQAIAVANSQQSASTAAAAAPVARQLNAPQSAIETDLPRYQAQALADTNAKVLAGNPQLASWVQQNPDAARIAQNELPALASLSPKAMDYQADNLGMDALGGYGMDIIRAMGRGSSELRDSFNLLVNYGLKGVGADQASNAFEQHFLSGGQNISKQLALSPEANFGDKAFDMVGNMTQMLSTAILTGPEEAIGAAQKLGAAAQEIGKQVVHGARTMVIPSMSSAINAANETYQQTGDFGQAMRVAYATFGTSELGGIAPLAAEGNIASRAAQSFVSGMTTGEVSRQAMNLVAPQISQFDPEQLILNGLGASILGMGGHGPVHEGLRDTAIDGLRAEQAEQGAAQIAKVSEFAQNSELKKADPVAFKSAIDTMMPDAKVYFDAKTFADTVSGRSGPDPWIL